MPRLLIPEPPLQVLPSLAVKIGLNEAMVLQQLHYWLERSQHVHDGQKWVYNTFEQWQAQFPFWSVKTIKRTFTSLEQARLVLVGHYGQSFDRTKWYSIDYAALGQLELDNPAPSIDPGRPAPSGQIGPIEGDRLAPSSSTETTQENTHRDQQQEDEELLLFISKVKNALEDEGVSPLTAQELAQANPDLAADWLEAKREWQGARNPAGLLVAKIRAGEQPPRPRQLRWSR